MRMRREKEKETRILACIISRIRRNFVSVKATFEKMLNVKSLAVRISYGVAILCPCRIESVAASYNIQQPYRFLHAVAVVLIIIISHGQLYGLIMTMRCTMAYEVVPLEDFSKKFESTTGQLSMVTALSSTELVFYRIIECIYRGTSSACF